MKTFAGKHFQIGYDTWGNPKGKAVLFFHGFPGSRVQAKGLTNLVDKYNIFLIAADRPGYGGTTGAGSSQQFVEDLSLLLDKYGAKRFSVLGVSGGSPWAHLMTSKYSDRVEDLRIVCGLGPFHSETRDYFSKFQSKALSLRKILPGLVAEKLIGQIIKKFKPETALARFAKQLGQPDEDTLNDPIYRELILSSLGEGRRQGAKGIVSDSYLYQRDWLRLDCDLKKLSSVPAIYFHGRRDRVLDYRMSEWMHKHNKNSQLVLFENEGHYSLAIRQAEAVLKSLS